MHSSSDEKKRVGTEGFAIRRKKFAIIFDPNVLVSNAIAEQCLVTSGLPQKIRASLSKLENVFPEAKIGETSQGQFSLIFLNIALLSAKFKIPSLY